MINHFIVNKNAPFDIWSIKTIFNDNFVIERLGDKIVNEINKEQIQFGFVLLEGNKIEAELRHIHSIEAGHVKQYFYTLISEKEELGSWYAIKRIDIHKENFSSEFVKLRYSGKVS